jgi:hypothetical protein
VASLVSCYVDLKALWWIFAMMSPCSHFGIFAKWSTMLEEKLIKGSAMLIPNYSRRSKL